MSLFEKFSDKMKSIVTPNVVGEFVQDSDTIKREMLIKEFESKLQEYKNLSEGKVGTYEEREDSVTGAKVTEVYGEDSCFRRTEIKDGEKKYVSYTGIMNVRDGNPDHEETLRYFDNFTVGRSDMLDNPELGFAYNYFTYGSDLTAGGVLTDHTSSESRSIHQIAPISDTYNLFTNAEEVFSNLINKYMKIEYTDEMEKE